MTKIAASDLYREFRGKFISSACFMLAVALLFSWASYVSTLQKKIRMRIDTLNSKIERTFNFLYENDSSGVAQSYLLFLKQENPEVDLAVFYDTTRKVITGSTELEWLGKPLSALPTTHVAEDINHALETGESHVGLKVHGDVYDSTLIGENGIMMIHIHNDVSRKALLAAALREELITFVILVVFGIAFLFILQYLFRPLNEELVNILKTSPFFLGKFQEHSRANMLGMWRFFGFTKAFFQNVEDVETHHHWTESVFEQLPVGVLFTNGTRAIHANNKMSEYLGVAPILAEGEGWKSQIFLEDHKKFYEEWDKSSSQNANVEFEIRLITPEGLVRWMQVVASPLRDFSGRPTGTLGTFTSIDKAKKLQEVVKNTEIERRAHEQTKAALEEEKGALITIISREVRTPLNVIEQTLEILRDLSDNNTESEFSDFLLVCKNNVRKIIQMMRDILEYEELEFAKKDWHFQEVDLSGIVQQVLAVIEPDFKAKGVELSSECSDSLPKVWGEEATLRQAIEHLIANALQFTEKGSVHVRLYLHEGQCIFEVKDTGIGIREEDFGNMFKLFTQIHSSNMRFGSGLGLALVKKIIEMHNGTITYESKFGEGSTFRLNIPIKEG